MLERLEDALNGTKVLGFTCLRDLCARQTLANWNTTTPDTAPTY